MPRDRNLARLPSGRYRARKTVQGVEHRRTFTYRDDAREWLRTLERHAAGLPVVAPSLTLQECLDRQTRHLITRSRSLETRTYYDRIHDTLRAHFGLGAGVASLTQRSIDTFVAARRAQGAGDARIAKELGALRALTRLSGIATDWRVPDFSRPPARRRLPPDHEIAAVYRALRRPELERAFLLALLAGLRPAELQRATWAWVDLADRTLTVEAAKAGGTHLTWIVDTLHASLICAVPAHAGPLIPISETALRSALYRRSLALRLAHPWTGLEPLRHACATWAYAAGATEHDIDVLLSHKTTSVARRHYLHATNLPLKRRLLECVEIRFLAAMEKLAAFAPS